MGEVKTDWNVGITEITPTEWRVSNRVREDGKHTVLLGYVRQLGDSYEAMRPGRNQSRRYFSSFERASASLTAPQAPIDID